MRVFVDQAAQDRFSADLPCIDVGHGAAGGVRFAVGDTLDNALVRAGRVVVRLVSGQDGAQVLLADDQDAACSCLLAKLVRSPDIHAAVIPTLAVLATRHFRRGKRKGGHEPKRPAVKFVLAAWNEGDFSAARKHVAPELAMSMNGFTYDPGPEDDGPALAKESIEYWRVIIPDLKMGLSQEIRQKDRIAIEWLITGTHTGERPELPASGNLIELQGSAFLTLKDDKIVEVSTVFDALALAVQTGAAEAPAWWPGRSHA